MKVELPSTAYLSDLDDLIALAVEDDEPDLTLVMPEGECLLHPLVLCMLASMSDRIRDNGGAVKLKDAALLPPALQRMHLFESLGLSDVGESVDLDPTGRYIPLKRIPDNRSIKDFVTDFVPLLHASAGTAETVKYVLWELIRNVLEHAGTKHGAWAAAEVTESGHLLVGVADAGVGIRKTIRRSHPADSEERAIELAFAPGISGATSRYGGDDQNGGAGLFFMKAMASLARQQMVMITGETAMRLEIQPTEKPEIFPSLEQDGVSWRRLETPFLGTAVGVDFALNDTVAFAELLNEIRSAYQLNVRVAKKERKKALFT